MKILIKVTKDVLKCSMMCGVNNPYTISNCAIAMAVREFFPGACVVPDKIYPFYNSDNGNSHLTIPLPWVATEFIYEFDDLEECPEKRLKMAELSFEITLPDNVINQINIHQAYKVLSESKTLELVSI